MTINNLPNFEYLIQIVYKTIELTQTLSKESLEKVMKELETNSSEIDLDQTLMLKIIKKYIDNFQA